MDWQMAVVSSRAFGRGTRGRQLHLKVYATAGSFVAFSGRDWVRLLGVSAICVSARALG